MGQDGATAITATVCQHFANEGSSGWKMEQAKSTWIRLGHGTRWKPTSYGGIRSIFLKGSHKPPFLWSWLVCGSSFKMVIKERRKVSQQDCHDAGHG